MAFTRISTKMHTKMATVLHKLEGASTQTSARRSLRPTENFDLHLFLLASDDDTKEKSARTLAEQLQRPEVVEETQNGAVGLIATVRDIRNAFKTITERFRGFESERFVAPSADPAQWVEKWLQFEKRFDALMDESHDNAIKAIALIRQFSGVILSDGLSIKACDLKLELSALIKPLDQKAKEALDNKTDFAGLARDIRGFAHEIRSAIPKSDEPMTEGLQKSMERMKSLEKQIEDVTAKLSSLGVAAVASLFTGVGAAMVAFFTLSPHAYVTALSAVAVAVCNGTHYITTRRQINRLASELGVERHKSKLLRDHEKQCEEDIKEVETQIRGVADKIDVISQIWNVLRVDMRSLLESLELVASPDAAIVQEYAPKKLEVIRAVYKHLELFLVAYVNQTS